MQIITFHTTRPTEFVDLTQRLEQTIKAEKWQNGFLLVFCPHTTASITLNENWDADVRHDLALKLDELVTDDPRFRHSEGNSAAHIKASLFGSATVVLVKEQKLQLGQWQGVYFAEWDGPRQRTIWTDFLPSP